MLPGRTPRGHCYLQRLESVVPVRRHPVYRAIRAQPFLITIAVIIATTAAPVCACARCALPRLSGNGGQCEKSSSARSEINREIRYEITCDATDVMRWVLRMKREANRTQIDAVLAATCERPIVEVSTRDPWWGARPVSALRAGIPRASVRFAHCALRLPGGSLTLSAACRTAAVAQRSTTSLGPPPRPPRAGASRRARRRPRLARPGRLRRLRALPPARPGALRASPVPASPRTGLRTTRCTAAPTSAVTAAFAFGSVLRTTACVSLRTAGRSPAAAAPLRRLRRLRFPEP